MSIFKKIPKPDDIAAVYAVIVAMVYFPTINRFFWKVPSWILSSTLGDLFLLYAYTVVVNFLESLLVLGAVLGLCMILPGKLFLDRFTSRAVLLVILTLGFLIYLGTQMQRASVFPWALVRQSPLILLVILLLVHLLDQIGFLRKFLAAAANRFIIFLYISIPVSILSLLVVLIRNIT